VEVPKPPAWFRVTLPTLREQEIAGPVPDVTEADKVTVPVKLWTLETVIDVLPELPETRVDDGELDEMLKSPTFTVMIVRWEMAPLVALTIKLYAPGEVVAEAETVIADKAEPPGDMGTLFWLNETDTVFGAEGRIDAERDTCPEKPVLLRLTITFEEDPTATAGFVGVALREKSPVTVSVTVAEWDVVPYLPITVTE
jgi:hypothetical protein